MTIFSNPFVQDQMRDRQIVSGLGLICGQALDVRISMRYKSDLPEYFLEVLTKAGTVVVEARGGHLVDVVIIALEKLDEELGL